MASAGGLDDVSGRWNCAPCRPSPEATDVKPTADEGPTSTPAPPKVRVEALHAHDGPSAETSLIEAQEAHAEVPVVCVALSGALERYLVRVPAHQPGEPRGRVAVADRHDRAVEMQLLGGEGARDGAARGDLCLL